MAEKLTYNCVFDKSKKCPVKQDYKLKPESLVEFCKICKVPEIDRRKLEFETFLQLAMKMVETQRKLGESEAKAEIYKKLYEESKGVSSKNG